MPKKMTITNDEKRFLAKLNARSRQLAEMATNGERSKEFVALEILMSMYSAYADNLEPSKVVAALAVPQWRADVVPVPRHLLSLVANAYADYTFQDNGRTFGECLGIEGGGQGKSRETTKQGVRDRNQALANRVNTLRLWAKKNHIPMTQVYAINFIFEEEAELGRDTSFETVRAAYRKYGRQARDALALGKRVKTSGSR